MKKKQKKLWIKFIREYDDEDDRKFYYENYFEDNNKDFKMRFYKKLNDEGDNIFDVSNKRKLKLYSNENKVKTFGRYFVKNNRNK